LIAALLHTIKHIERMGDQCVNIAKLLPLAGNEPPRRPELLDKLIQMGQSRAPRSSRASRRSPPVTSPWPRT